MDVTIYGCRVSEKGALGAGLALQFHPWAATHSQTTAEGITIEINPSDVWTIIVPDGANFSDDTLQLLWMLNGQQQESNAQDVLGLADHGLHGFHHKGANLDGIKAAIQDQSKIVKLIEDRRKKWQEISKKLILKTLSALATDPSRHDARINNHPSAESVFFGFLPVLVGTEHSGQKGIFRMGGYLFYSLNGDGTVFVWHSFPYMEDKEKRPLNRGLATLEPDKITEALILEHVEQFLKNISATHSALPGSLTPEALTGIINGSSHPVFPDEAQP
jgi:hypothetical protein